VEALCGEEAATLRRCAAKAKKDPAMRGVKVTASMIVFAVYDKDGLVGWFLKPPKGTRILRHIQVGSYAVNAKNPTFAMVRRGGGWLGGWVGGWVGDTLVWTLEARPMGRCACMLAGWIGQ
jgi:hypothetical protein